MNIGSTIIITFLSLITGLVMGWYTHYHTIKLKNRQQKEEHYQKFIAALINLKRNTDDDAINYSICRNTMLTFASVDVVIKLQEYENSGMGKDLVIHDSYLTSLIQAIRKDLNVSSKGLPVLIFKYFNGW